MVAAVRQQCPGLRRFIAARHRDLLPIFKVNAQMDHLTKVFQIFT